MKLQIIIFAVFLYSGFALKADGLLFKPLVANVFEPRVGAILDLTGNNTRLDIGTSIDLSTLYKSENTEIRLGGDFFTWTLLNNKQNFTFPVEAVDYFFGVNVSSKTSINNTPIEWRVRLAHISAHLADGYSMNGFFNEMPFVYSREFVEATAATYYKNTRFYAGLTAVFSTKPDDAGNLIPQIGFDGEQRLFKNIYASYGYDLKVKKIKDEFGYSGSGQVGIIFKSTMKTGLGLYYYQFNGFDVHGLFYDKKRNYSGIGFQLIF